MFDSVYEFDTPRIAEGREQLERLRERHGDDALTRDE
jgi:hypothetical protein